ncbi:hypothetical protein CYMTET_39249, partial [Cymbomonas tetramitiformis]
MPDSVLEVLTVVIDSYCSVSDSEEEERPSEIIASLLERSKSAGNIGDCEAVLSKILSLSSQHGERGQCLLEEALTEYFELILHTARTSERCGEMVCEIVLSMASACGARDAFPFFLQGLQVEGIKPIREEIHNDGEDPEAVRQEHWHTRSALLRGIAILFGRLRRGHVLFLQDVSSLLSATSDRAAEAWHREIMSPERISTTSTEAFPSALVEARGVFGNMADVWLAMRPKLPDEAAVEALHRHVARYVLRAQCWPHSRRCLSPALPQVEPSAITAGAQRHHRRRPASPQAETSGGAQRHHRRSPAPPQAEPSVTTGGDQRHHRRSPAPPQAEPSATAGGDQRHRRRSPAPPQAEPSATAGGAQRHRRRSPAPPQAEPSATAGGAQRHRRRSPAP